MAGTIECGNLLDQVHYFFINQYYPPDSAPTGLALQALAEDISKSGHTVTVFCSKGETYAGTCASSDQATGKPNKASAVHLVRVSTCRFGRFSFFGKFLDYLSFYIFVFLKIISFNEKPDRIIALTTPPFLSVLARLASKFRGADHAHWVLDIYPDVLTAHGYVKKKGLTDLALIKMAGWGFGGERCAGVLTIGPDMEERLKAYVKDPEKITWVPLWNLSDDSEIDAQEVSELRKKRGWGEDELILMYSGNMGLGHLFDELLDASRNLPEKAKIVFYGSGKRRQEIEQFIRKNPEAKPELHDYVPTADLAKHLTSADAHLVSLRPDWDGVMLPSKLQSIFAKKRPVIFIGSENNSIARWIKESQGGWVVPPNSSEALEQAIKEAKEPKERARRGDAAYRFYKSFFDKKTRVLQSIDFLCGAGVE